MKILLRKIKERLKTRDCVMCQENVVIVSFDYNIVFITVYFMDYFYIRELIFILSNLC